MSVTIVAELGQNHNSDMSIVIRMIESAARCGANYVKFQRRHPNISVPDHMKYQTKETPMGSMTYLEYRNWLELPLSAYETIDIICKRVGIGWFTSVFDIPSLEDMARFELPYIKIPSACLTDIDLIKAAKATNKPVIVSTGMSTPAEIRKAASFLTTGDVICQCNSTYPCLVEDLNLSYITVLAHAYPHLIPGYSGHEVGLATTIAAVALGATYIERHFTLDRSMWGSDQAASVEPGGMRRLVHDIRNVEQALGDGIKRVTPGELDAMKRLRRI